MKIRALTSLIALGAIVLLPLAASAEEQLLLVDKVLAIVNDSVLTIYDIDKALAPYIPRFKKVTDATQRAKMVARARQTFLKKLIDDELILQRANELNLKVTEPEVDHALKVVKKRSGMNDQQFVAAMKQAGFTVEEYRGQLRKELLMTRVRQLKVVSKLKISERTVREILEQDYYKGKFEDQVRVSHILIEVQPWYDQARITKARNECLRILKKVKEGKTSFAKLAEGWSDDDESADKGGDIGWVSRGQTDAALDVVLFKTPLRDVRGPIRSRFGFHVVTIAAKRQVPIKDVEVIKAKIRSALRQKEFKKRLAEWIRELRLRAYIKEYDFE